nr:MAG TPA: hypothetical protein [Caudoviricetes sp.]
MHHQKLVRRTTKSATTRKTFARAKKQNTSLFAPCYGTLNATFEQKEKNILYKNILNRTSLWLTLLVTIVSLAAPVCPNAPLKQSLRAIFIRLTQTLAPSVAHALVFVPARLSACRKEQTN